METMEAKKRPAILMKTSKLIITLWYRSLECIKEQMNKEKTSDRYEKKETFNRLTCRWKTMNYRGQKLQEQYIFYGFGVDVGVHGSIMGVWKQKRNCKEMKMRFNPETPSSVIRFANSLFKSIGKIKYQITAPNNSFIKYSCDIISTNIPMLIWLDVLDRGLLAQNPIIKGFLSHLPGLCMEKFRKFGYRDIAWSSKKMPFYSPEREIRKLRL